VKTVRNISRAKTENMRFLKDDDFWISIGEPGSKESVRESDFHIDFWNIEHWDLEHQDHEYPSNFSSITEDQAKELVAILLKNKDKNIVVNCMTGISRSSAVCRFCEECLGYKWETEHKSGSMPNTHVFNSLKSAYECSK
jgi:predicted protein tyrosine phosphatase